MNNTIKLRIPTTEEWDRMIDITGEDNAIIHWEDMFFWVHDGKFEKERPSFRATRGYHSARCWSYSPATHQYADLGFRPAFDNLSSDGIKNGDIIPVGTLYMNGKPVKVPQNPVWNGDIEDYTPGATLSFGPPMDDPAYVVTAIKVDDVFIADRVLLKRISYENITKACTVHEDSHKTLMQMLIDAGYPTKDMFHHESDLYVYITPVTKRVLEKYYKLNNLNRSVQATTFRDQITGAMMYDCAFAYDPYWEGVAEKSIASREKSPVPPGPVDFTIVSKPDYIHLECPHCGDEIDIRWKDANAPADWNDDWDDVTCPDCGKAIKLGEHEYE